MGSLRRAEPASPAPGPPLRCLVCAFPLERDAGLLVLVDRFKAMLSYAGYSLRSLNLDGDESSPQVSLRLELGVGERETRKRRRAEQQSEKRKKARRGGGLLVEEDCAAQSCGSCASSCCGYEECRVEGCEAGCDGECKEVGLQKKGEAPNDRREQKTERSAECESCTHMHICPSLMCGLRMSQTYGSSKEQTTREQRSTDNELENRREEKGILSEGNSPPSLGTLPTQAPMIGLDSSRGERVASAVNSGIRGGTAPTSNTNSNRKGQGSDAGYPGLVKNTPQGRPLPLVVGKRSSGPGEPHTCSVLPSNSPNDFRREAGSLPSADLNRPPGERCDDAAQVEKTARVRPAADPSGRKPDGPKFVLQPKRADNRIPCQVKGCDQTFCRASTAKRHFYRLHMGMAGTFICKYCFKELGDKGTLRMHIQAVHEKRRPWICRLCGARFTQSSSLHRHCRDIHNLKKSD